MKRYYTLLLFFTLAAAAMAATIQGRVVDETGTPIEFATVAILSADSTFITGTTTDAAGTFSIDAASQASLVKVSYIGYQMVVTPCRSDVGSIALLPESTMLGEVTVTATRPVYKLTSEGIKTDVENTLLSRVGTASEVLQNLPGVQKDGNKVEVFGKGTPLIYINGRMMRNDTELAQIKSEDIKSVELITNPGAKYDASVESVILIKTRRQQGEGFGFNTTASYYQDRYASWALGADWNYRRRGLDVFGAVWYNDDRMRYREDVLLDVAGAEHWLIDGKLRAKRHANSIYTMLGLNYIFNDNHAAGFRYDTKAWFTDRDDGAGVSEVWCNDEQYDRIINGISSRSKHNMPHTLNAYYNGKIGKTSIDFNTDYVFNKGRDLTINDERSEEDDSRIVTSESVARNRLWASKLVLSWTLGGGNLQVGAEYDRTIRNDDYINPENVVPTSYSEQRERNYIFFTEFARPLPFGSMRLGLRNENVKTDYYESGVYMPEQSRNNHHLFPTVGLNAKAGNVQLMANWSMKIQRPYYFMLSNTVNYVNRFMWSGGNPYLKPSKINQLSLMAMWRWMTVMLDYKRTGDIIVNVARDVEGQESVTLVTRENVDHADALRAMVSLNPQFGMWQPRLTLGIMRDWIDIPSPTGIIRPKNPIGIIQLNNNFRFTPTLTASANLAITTRGDKENLHINRAAAVLYLSLTKTFLSDRLSLQVAGHNLLGAYDNVTIDYGTRTIGSIHKNYMQKLEVTVRYKFNPTGSKYRGSGAGEAEKSRLGN